MLVVLNPLLSADVVSVYPGHPLLSCQGTDHSKDYMTGVLSYIESYRSILFPLNPASSSQTHYCEHYKGYPWSTNISISFEFALS